MPWFEVAQLFPKGLNYLKKNQPCLVEETAKWWEMASCLRGAVMEVGGSLEVVGGTFPGFQLSW